MNSEQIMRDAIELGLRNPFRHVLNGAGDACEDGTSAAGANPCPACKWSREELPGMVQSTKAARHGRGTFSALPWSGLTTLLLVITLVISGCGTPKTTTPVSKLPNMAGTWTGEIVLQGYQPSLKLVLTEDSAGNLNGVASSDSGCNFSLPVSGAIYADYTFSVQAADPTALLLAGSMANNSVAASGYGNLGNGTDCGPATGASFYLGRH